MTAPTQENQTLTDKELNFRALEAKYQRKFEQERQARLEAERIAQEAQKKNISNEEDDDYSEPYIDHKKLKKEQAKLGQQIKQETQSEIQKAVQLARQEAAQEAWLENNPNFYDILNKNADKLAAKSPAIAKSILAMPDTFERQKLVYQTIIELGLHEDKPKESPIQQKINQNQRHPIQPGSMASAPYAGQQSDFSDAGQKAAYEKMQELKARLQI